MMPRGKLMVWLALLGKDKKIAACCKDSFVNKSHKEIPESWFRRTSAVSNQMSCMKTKTFRKHVQHHTDISNNVRFHQVLLPEISSEKKTKPSAQGNVIRYSSCLALRKNKEETQAKGGKFQNVRRRLFPKEMHQQTRKKQYPDIVVKKSHNHARLRSLIISPSHNQACFSCQSRKCHFHPLSASKQIWETPKTPKEAQGNAYVTKAPIFKQSHHISVRGNSCIKKQSTQYLSKEIAEFSKRNAYVTEVPIFKQSHHISVRRNSCIKKQSTQCLSKEIAEFSKRNAYVTEAPIFKQSHHISVRRNSCIKKQSTQYLSKQIAEFSKTNEKKQCIQKLNIASDASLRSTKGDTSNVYKFFSFIQETPKSVRRRQSLHLSVKLFSSPTSSNEIGMKKYPKRILNEVLSQKGYESNKKLKR